MQIMSKELEALDRLYCSGNLQLDYVLSNQYKQDYEIVKQALQELQAIKNAKPSEAMERFDYIGNDIIFAYDDDYVSYDYTDDVEYIKQALIKAQEQEKVLNVIIKKNVSVWGFRNRVFGYQKEQNGNKIINDTYEYYLNNFGCYHNGFDIELLTKEEFDILKEYFK